MMFAHKHFALHALLDLFAFELLQDGGICHTGTHMTKQNHHLSHVVDYEMCLTLVIIPG